MWEPFLYFSPLVLFSLAYISLAMELARVKTRMENEGKKDEAAIILAAQIQELENDIENLLEQEMFGELSADGLVYNVIPKFGTMYYLSIPFIIYGFITFVILISIGFLFNINPLDSNNWNIDIASNFLKYFMVAVT